LAPDRNQISGVGITQGDDRTEYVVMKNRLGKCIDYVDENSWRFGLALTAIVALEMALIVLVIR
jgi:hypothetical protein